jgi:hypothetical protein
MKRYVPTVTTAVPIVELVWTSWRKDNSMSTPELNESYLHNSVVAKLFQKVHVFYGTKGFTITSHWSLS